MFFATDAGRAIEDMLKRDTECVCARYDLG